MPRVSVIVAAYNCEAYVAQALRSVQEQTYGAWEVVFADDGSTDGTAEIARGFSGVTVVESRVNTGLPAARNRAIERARGELLAILDADDYWLPGYLEHQVDLFDRSQASAARVGIVACNARLLAPSGGILESSYMDCLPFREPVTLTELLRGNSIYVSALVPRGVVEEVGGFHQELKRMPDWDLWLRILEHGYRVVATHRPLCVYRLRPGSLSRDVHAMAIEAQVVYRRALERGNLTARQRRIVHRGMRLQLAAAELSGGGGRSPRRLLRLLPLLALVVAENPSHWRSFARALDGRGGFGQLAPAAGKP
jgi:glycosyltransferase involved in cell wall biosynthesis